MLSWAAEEGLADLSAALLQLSPGRKIVNQADVAGSTPLHCACLMNRLEVVRVLLMPLPTTHTGSTSSNTSSSGSSSSSKSPRGAAAHVHVCNKLSTDAQGWTAFCYALFNEYAPRRSLPTSPRCLMSDV